MESERKIFPIKPAPPSTMVFVWIVMVVLVGMMVYFMMMIDGMAWLFLSTFLPIIAIFGIVAMSTRKTRFEITRNGLEITGDWAGETVSWRDLDVAHARIVRFESEPQLKPKWKTVGLAMPGYCSGWFRLYDKSKALIYLTSKEEAVYVPTRKDYSILMSASDNPGFLQALKAGQSKTIRTS